MVEKRRSEKDEAEKTAENRPETGKKGSIFIVSKFMSHEAKIASLLRK